MFTSLDVYDAASSIGHECQLIVSQYGPDILQNLMPKLISVLEDLETCSLYCEKETDEIARLQETAECLRSDCRTQAELQDKADQTLEQMEQSWYCETQRLLSEVTEIEEENNRLAHQLASEPGDYRTGDVLCDAETRSTVGSVLRAAASGLRVELPPKLSIATLSVDETQMGDELMSNVLSEVGERLQLTEQDNRAADLQLIGRLRECVSANYKEMRALSRDIFWVSTALDAAEEEVCRLARRSGQLMSSRAPHRRQLDHLAAERATVEYRLRLKERELSEVLQNLSLNDNCIKNATAVTTNNSDSHDDGYNSSVANRNRKQSILLALSPSAVAQLSSALDAHSNPSDAEVIDRSDDPAALEELRHLLQERNEFRCRLIQLDEELRVLEQESTNDPDVEGPLPPEPLNKFRPGWNENSDIRTIFRQLLHRLAEMTPRTE
ncbi:unnamed protein product [Dicrocoelium dendriticum]|nr:unnamed protein product [Dicrocoelium dendriticum]